MSLRLDFELCNVIIDEVVSGLDGIVDDIIAELTATTGDPADFLQTKLDSAAAALEAEASAAFDIAADAANSVIGALGDAWTGSSNFFSDTFGNSNSCVETSHGFKKCKNCDMNERTDGSDSETTIVTDRLGNMGSSGAGKNKASCMQACLDVQYTLYQEFTAATTFVARQCQVGGGQSKLFYGFLGDPIEGEDDCKQLCTSEVTCTGYAWHPNMQAGPPPPPPPEYSDDPFIAAMQKAMEDFVITFPSPPPPTPNSPPPPDYSGGGGKRRRLQGDEHRRRLDTEQSPIRVCMDYDAAKAAVECLIPSITPAVASETAGFEVERFAQDWLEYMCCQTVSSDPSQWASNLMTWRQTCASLPVLRKANPGVDGLFLKEMELLCPNDVEEEDLAGWAMDTFRPAMQAKNPFWDAIPDGTCDEIHIDQLPDGPSQWPTVTVLLTDTADSHHVALLIHNDKSVSAVPHAFDTHAYVSWLPAVATGLSTHTQQFGLSGWGQDDSTVTEAITLYGGNVTAMLAEWAAIKDGSTKFDIVRTNCAVVTMRILASGFGNVCPSLPDGSDWISPRGVFKVAESISSRTLVNGLPSSLPQLTVGHVHAAQIALERSVTQQKLPILAPPRTRRSRRQQEGTLDSERRQLGSHVDDSRSQFAGHYGACKMYTSTPNTGSCALIDPPTDCAPGECTYSRQGGLSKSYTVPAGSSHAGRVVTATMADWTEGLCCSINKNNGGRCQMAPGVYRRADEGNDDYKQASADLWCDTAGPEQPLACAGFTEDSPKGP